MKNTINEAEKTLEGISSKLNDKGIDAWRSPWTEEPGGLQSMGLGRVGHDLAT